MPGIVGIISQKTAVETAPLVNAMVATMRHERFYVTGTFAAPELGVSAGWVAHENSFAAKQVFQNEQKTIMLVFSGECFVDSETRKRLNQNGHAFSETDGSWLIRLYEEAGEKFFAELNGLFSGLLIDRRQHKVFLFNDRYGMERIYWHETPDAFYFASEAKALLRILPAVREFDAEGATQFLAIGSTLDGRTLFRGVQMLPGGSCWTFSAGRCVRNKYFSPAAWEAQPVLKAGDFEAKFSEVFNKILPAYFVTENKIGIALTGGLDTRMIMACRPKNSGSQICYTFSGADDALTLDDKIATRVAKASGLDHQLLRLRADFFADFAMHADRTVHVTDGTFGILGAHEIYFHRQARALSPWRLTGNFGSEVLRGVSTYKPLRLEAKLFNPELARSVMAASGQLAGQRSQTHPDTFASFKEVPWNLFGSVAAGRSQVTFRTPFLDNQIVALAYQMPAELRKSSLACMRFIHANNPAMSAIPTDRGFTGHNSGPLFLARRMFAEVTFKMDYYYNEGLPGKISLLDPAFVLFAGQTKLAGTHKYLRYSRWFRNELADYVRQSCSGPLAGAENFFDPDFIQTLAEAHISGQKNYSSEINAVLTLAAVGRQLVGRN